MPVESIIWTMFVAIVDAALIFMGVVTCWVLFSDQGRNLEFKVQVLLATVIAMGLLSILAAWIYLR